MIRIGDTIFSLQLLEKKFVCDLPKCHGNCCRYGDSGAPLESDEVGILDKIFPDVKPYMRPEGLKVIETLGTSIKDFENDHVTPLVNNEECAYTIIEGNMFLCAIERAWSEGKINFRKPLSCHLFPARMKKFTDFRAVNYIENKLCEHARLKGKEKGVFVYQFLKVPLIRAVGSEIYAELCIAAEELRKQRASEK